MESLNPALSLLMSVRRNLGRGLSVKAGVTEFIRQRESPFNDDVSLWFSLWQQGQPTEKILHQQKSVYRRVLLQTLERGLRGEPVYNYLLSLEEEIIKACEESMKDTMTRLPFILMIPLLLFQMPAFLLLLFGPILSQFLAALG